MTHYQVQPRPSQDLSPVEAPVSHGAGPLWRRLVDAGLLFLALAAVALLTFSCSPERPELGELEQPIVDSNPLTFWWWDREGAVLLPALECALDRVRAAACLPVDVSLDAHHWTRQRAQSTMPGLTGRTTGPWDETRIAVVDTADKDQACRILVHEIGEHVLRRRNDHAVSASNSKLTEALVASICEVQACGCFNPEE